MTSEEIKQEFPEMFVNCFDFSIGDGWLPMVKLLCKHIKHHCDKRHSDRSLVYVHQIKEKMGGLRFYVSESDDFIFGMIQFAETMSYHICEFCGSTDDILTTGGWRKTLCKGCRVKREELIK